MNHNFLHVDVNLALYLHTRCELYVLWLINVASISETMFLEYLRLSKLHLLLQ